MDLNHLIGKYRRLRDELTRASDAAHRRRLVEEITRLERRLADAGLAPFADTLPLDDG